MELVGQAALHPGLHECFVIVRYGEVRHPVRVTCHAHLPGRFTALSGDNLARDHEDSHPHAQRH